MIFEGRDVTVLLAGAGAGKTTKLMSYIEKELETRRPEEIAFVTFTRKGVREGLQRACNKLGYDANDFPYFRTMHSLSFHALGLKRSDIFDSKHEAAFNKQYGYCVNRERGTYNKNKVTGTVNLTKDSTYLSLYDLERCGALTTAKLAESCLDDGYYRSLVRDYEEYKADKCLVDFTDCLVRYAQEGDSLPCTVVFVDECQDLTPLQWRVVEVAFKGAEKIYVAGDEKQCLFAYGGASPEILIDLAKRFPVVHLDRSYRIPLSVYRFADAITQAISQKTDLRLKPREENGEGSVERIAQLAQLSHCITYDDSDNVSSRWYLLARNRCFLPMYFEMLEEKLIPYWTDEGFFMDGEVMRRLKLYYKYGCPGHDGEQKKKFAEQFNIHDFSEPFTSCDMFDDDRKWVYMSYVEHYGMQALMDMCKAAPQIFVGTIHSVKGGEADNVAVMLDMSPRTAKGIFEDMDYELRCLYVAVTRAKQRLYVIDSQKQRGYDDILDMLCDEFDLSFSA